MASYNEVLTIKGALDGLLDELKKLPFPFEVLVIDSSSTDGTLELLQDYQKSKLINLLIEAEPRGKGSAIRLGIENVQGDVFLIFDADCEYEPADIRKLLVPIESGKTSFVLGTRHTPGEKMRVMDHHKFRPFLMNFAHKFFTYLLNLTCAAEMTDPFTMYKIFRIEVFTGVPLYSNRFDLDWELVIKAIRRGAKPIELPVIYKSRSFTEGKKVRFFKDPINWILALIRFRYFEKLPN